MINVNEAATITENNQNCTVSKKKTVFNLPKKIAVFDTNK